MRRHRRLEERQAGEIYWKRYGRRDGGLKGRWGE